MKVHFSQRSGRNNYFDVKDRNKPKTKTEIRLMQITIEKLKEKAESIIIDGAKNCILFTRTVLKRKDDLRKT